MGRDRSEILELPDSLAMDKEIRRIRYARRNRHSLKRALRTVLVIAAIATLLAVYLMPVVRIYGSSMAPTLENGQLVAAWRGAEFENGQLVAFYYGNKLLIKRVIAGPGDVVEIDAEGTVTVNGAALDEPYLSEKTLGDCDLSFPYTVPAERYFVLGDDRSLSVDSRSSVVGCISQDAIIGRVFLRFWPLNEITLFEA